MKLGDPLCLMPMKGKEILENRWGWRLKWGNCWKSS
jgi:hypothetical protein